MKIKIKELRAIVREELARKAIVEGSAEDKAAYDKIMSMINSVLGDSPEAEKLGGDLSSAMSKKTLQPGSTLSLKSVAAKGPVARMPAGDDVISMKSIK